jgi:hypothetical protein
MIEILKEKVQKFYSDKNLVIFLSIWFITYFFGSNIGGLSLGHFTVYPNFILNLLFIPVVFYSIRKYNTTFKYYSVLLLLFVIYSIIWIAYNSKSIESIFDLRSHIFNLLTFLIISSCYLFFKTKVLFTQLVKNTLWGWLVLLIVFGFMEVITGFHFSGNYTKSINDTAFKLIDFAPIFIFDNPNDFILNCIVTLLILLFIDSKIFVNKVYLVSVLFSVFILSIYASSRIGQLIILAIFGIVFLKFYAKDVRNLCSEYKLIVLVFSCCVFLLLISNKVYYGKNTSNVNSHIDGGIIIQKNNGKFSIVEVATNLSRKEKSELSKQINLINNKPGFNSSAIRMKLIENGLYLIKKNPVFGVGPGQFSVLNLNQKVPNFTGENVSPHNYLIEIISQYGLLAICFLSYLLVLFVRLLKFRTETSFWLIVSMILLFLSSNMPSAFIYQPIYWLFMTLWIIYYHIEKEKYSVR